MTNFEMVQEFQKKFSCHMDMSIISIVGTKVLMQVAETIRREAGFLTLASTQNTDNRLIRGRLMCEELAELLEAMANNNLNQIAKESSDVRYVVYGTEDAYNIPADEVFAEVHRSNMSKSQERDQGGKILKGSDYITPNLEAIMENVK